MSDDSIKRSDAIQAITYPHLDNLTKEERIAHINAIPSADRPQGEWINKGAVCQCPRCKGYSRGLLEEKNGKLCEPHKLIYPRFCPNCGVRLKGTDDESTL